MNPRVSGWMAIVLLVSVLVILATDVWRLVQLREFRQQLDRIEQRINNMTDEAGGHPDTTPDG